MKKNLNPKRLFSCALLMLGGISSLHAATLTVTVTDNTGAKLPGAFVYWGQSTQSSPTNKLGTGTGITDANGVVTGDIPDGISYKVKVTSYGTSETHAAASSGPINGTNNLTDNFQTTGQVTIEAKSAGVDVAGIGVEYIDGSSWRSAGPTGANGKKVMQVFAFSTLTVRANASGSLDTRIISSANPVASFDNLVKLQSPNTELIVAGSWISANSGKYVFPNTYPARVNVNNNYSCNVLVDGSVFNKVPVVICVTDHDNKAIKGATLRGGYGTIPNGGGFGWHCNPTNDKGISIEWANPAYKICSYEATVNGTTATISKDVTVTNGYLFNFKSSLLTLKLKNCAGEGIPKGTARYGIGTNYSQWYVPGKNSTDDAGITSMEAFPGTYSFEMGINTTTEVKTIDFDGTNGLCWTTSKVAINWPYGVAFGGDGNSAWFPNKAGTEMLPGTWNFRFDGPAGQNFAPIEVKKGECAINKSAIVVRLIESDGKAIVNGQPSYYSPKGWVSMPLTNASGNSVAVMDAAADWMYTNMSYLGGVQQKIEDLTTNRIVTYQTKPVTIDFKKSDNTTVLEGENLQFYSDGWRTFGSHGSTTMELLPLNYYFRLSYLGGTEQKYQAVASNTVATTVEFRTKPVTIDFKDSHGKMLAGDNVQFYSNDWKDFGSSTNLEGQPTIELLPLSYFFRLSYLGGTEQKQQAVASTSTTTTVEFRTKEVTIDFKDSHGNMLNGDNLQFYSNEWKDFGNGTNLEGQPTIELLPLTYYFHLSYHGATEQKYQAVAATSASTTVEFRTVEVSMELNEQNPLKLGATDLEFYSNDWKTFGNGTNTMELLPLTYYFRLSYTGSALPMRYQDVATNQVVSFVAPSAGSLTRKIANTLATTVSLYPNPATSNLHVSMPAAGTVEIFSIDGKKLAQYEVSEGTATIDISTLPVGNHIMIAHYGDQHETIKFVKM